MKILVFIFTLVLSQLLQAEQSKAVYDCTPAKEYITTYNFLIGQKQLELPESQSELIATEVSKGCKNSAKRFVETFQVLIKSEAGSEAAVKYGLILSQKKDSHQKMFLKIFTSSFSRDQLNLDLNSSLKLASRLSVDFTGDIKLVGTDFTKMTEFCLSEKLGLSYGQCAQLSQRVILHSEKYKKPVADSFISAYNYLTNNKQLTMNKSAALLQAEQLISVSPKAFENFKLAFEFKQKKYTIKDSLRFANQIAKKTFFKHDLQRVPASNQKDQ